MNTERKRPEGLEPTTGFQLLPVFCVKHKLFTNSCFPNKSTTVELVNKNQFVLILNNNQIPLSQNDIDVLTSFLLDATDEYMAYDHIDLEFQIENTEIDVCFMRL